MNSYVVSFTDEEGMLVQIYIDTNDEVTDDHVIEQALERLSSEFEELEYVSIIQVQPANIALIYTAVEAAELWSLDVSTVKKACQTDRFASEECRKSKGTWLVTRAGMERVYGPKPTDTER